MTDIFISHAEENVECLEQIRKELEAKGYTIWREPPTLTRTSVLYPCTAENAILSSVAVVVVWDGSAAKSEQVEHHLHFAQQLKKLILPVRLDETPLPSTLSPALPITKKRIMCSEVVSVILPHLPISEDTDSLVRLYEQAAHELIRVRKEAIDLAAEMLHKGEHSEAVLAVLEYLVQHDSMMGVRAKAQDVIDTIEKKVVSPLISATESHHTFGVRCRNGHLSHFDKRYVCSKSIPVQRDIQQNIDVERDELHLQCDTCGIEIVAYIDCRGYK